MSIFVEPIDGTDLERLVTVLINATGVVHSMIESEVDVGTEGLDVIHQVAEALRQLLAPLAEHHGDDELRRLVGLLLEATLLLAHGIGRDDVFRLPR